jgi:hypothetical protein
MGISFAPAAIVKAGGDEGEDMQQAMPARAPAHLWIVGVLATLWYAFACYDYFMTQTANQAYLSKFPPEWITYTNGLPAWTTGTWALGVWGGLAGSILLLLRSRFSVWAFALSLVAAVVGLGYQMFMTVMPASMKAGLMGMFPWLIIAIAAFLAWYSWNAEKKGLLR